MDEVMKATEVILGGDWGGRNGRQGGAGRSIAADDRGEARDGESDARLLIARMAEVQLGQEIARSRFLH